MFIHDGVDDDPIIIPVTTPVRFLDNLVEVAHTDAPNPAVRN